MGTYIQYICIEYIDIYSYPPILENSFELEYIYGYFFCDCRFRNQNFHIYQFSIFPYGLKQEEEISKEDMLIPFQRQSQETEICDLLHKTGKEKKREGNK